MRFFQKATLSKQPRTPDSGRAAYLLAGLLTVFALGQLFAFDEFLSLIGDFGFFGGNILANFLGSLIVISEVFAIPFLLSMRLSHLARAISMVLGWLVSMIWLGVAVWINATGSAAPNVGFLGTEVQLIPGWWAVSFAAALCILTVWVSWGLWPGKRKK